MHYSNINQSSGWAGLSPTQPSPARPSPAHGPKFFGEKTMGWAGPTHFFGGRPWAKSFGPWFGFLIKYRFHSLSLVNIMKDVCWYKRYDSNLIYYPHPQVNNFPLFLFYTITDGLDKTDHFRLLFFEECKHSKYLILISFDREFDAL